MTKGQLIGWAIGILLAGGLVVTGALWAIMRDGRRRQDEYDRAWAKKRAELEDQE